MKRLEGWESRLAKVIEDARNEPYILGEHDCFRFACFAIQALIGVDYWKAWSGKYHSKTEAAKLLMEYGGGFTASGSKLFGCKPEKITLARRGDIVEYFDVESHLGVCIGERVAVLNENGLSFMPLMNCRHVWRIG